MPNFSWAKPYANKGRRKFFRPAELIQTPILIGAELSSKGEKRSCRSNCLQNMLWQPSIRHPSKLLLIYMYSCYGDFIPIEMWTPRRGTKVKFNAPFKSSSPKRHPVQHSRCRKPYPVQRHIHCTDLSQVKERPPPPQVKTTPCRVQGWSETSLSYKQTDK